MSPCYLQSVLYQFIMFYPKNVIMIFSAVAAHFLFGVLHCQILPFSVLIIAGNVPGTNLDLIHADLLPFGYSYGTCPMYRLFMMIYLSKMVMSIATFNKPGWHGSVGPQIYHLQRVKICKGFPCFLVVP